MEGAQLTEKRVSSPVGGRLRAVDPSEHLLVRNIEPGLDLAQLGIGKVHQFGIGEAAHHQVHFADAAVPQSELELAPPQSSPSLEISVPLNGFLQRHQKPDGAGAGYIGITL